MDRLLVPTKSCPYRCAPEGRVHVFDASALPWQATANPGLKMKSIRRDDERGEFLGLICFEPFTRSSLHQHQGVATSFALQGSLTDYQGALSLHEVGINVHGSTHDAMAYSQTVLVSKLEAPVAYPLNDGPLTGLHAGSHHKAFRNPDPQVWPDRNVAVDGLVKESTLVAGVARQTIFDYADTGLARRMVQWQCLPESTVPEWQASDWVEFWIRGGELVVNGERAHANCFVVIEPGATVRLASPFGALLLAWAEGRERRMDGVGDIDLFGF